ncbi:MAG: hypothetical protein Q9166_007121 [cf. Caloplaca sp. 2 TL-2023]
MKTTLFTIAASLVASVIGTPIAVPRVSLIEDRQEETSGGGYGGGRGNACGQLARHPTKAQEVAGALKIIVAANTRFAVRSGGHMPNVGSNNVNGGVLIGTDRMNGKKISQFNGIEVAQLGPGNRWFDVYEWSSSLGKLVNGGRYAPVGVGGLLIGGGLSYFGSENGWCSNLVLQYELVTADSRIIYVTKAAYPELFWALKGGSTNYGIVTRYDTKTYPLNDVYAGFIDQDAKDIPALLNATAGFVAPKTGGSLDPKAAIDVTIFFNATSRLFSTTTSLFYNQSISTAPKPLADFVKIPVNKPSTVRRRTYVDFETETEYSANRSFRQLFRATSTKSIPQVVNFLYKIFEAKAKTLRPVTGLIISFVYQPLTTDLLKASRANGGDAIDLDPADGPIMGMIVNAAWENAADDNYVNGWAAELIDSIDAQAKTAGYYYPFIFLNDAATGQKVLNKYGKGASLPKLKTVAQRFDPNGVFQTLAGGAFKVSTQ